MNESLTTLYLFGGPVDGKKLTADKKIERCNKDEEHWMKIQGAFYRIRYDEDNENIFYLHYSANKTKEMRNR